MTISGFDDCIVLLLLLRADIAMFSSASPEECITCITDSLPSCALSQLINFCWLRMFFFACYIRLFANSPEGLKVKGVGSSFAIKSIYHSTLHFAPWSLDLFIRVPFQLNREHTVLQPFRRIELVVHIAISVLPGTHFHVSQVKHLRVKCLAQDTPSKQCPKFKRGETWYFSENPAPSGIWTRSAGSDIDIYLRYDLYKSEPAISPPISPKK